MTPRGHLGQYWPCSLHGSEKAFEAPAVGRQISVLLLHRPMAEVPVCKLGSRLTFDLNGLLGPYTNGRPFRNYHI